MTKCVRANFKYLYDRKHTKRGAWETKMYFFAGMKGWVAITCDTQFFSIQQLRKSATRSVNRIQTWPGGERTLAGAALEVVGAGCQNGQVSMQLACQTIPGMQQFKRCGKRHVEIERYCNFSPKCDFSKVKASSC